MFSKNLKYLRQKNGMEQLDLAQRLGRKSASSVSEWERGTYTPKAGILADISKIFNVQLDSLMNDDLERASFNNENLKPVNNNSIKYYNFFDSGLSAKLLSDVDPFSKNNIKKIPISDLILGRYADDQEIFFTFMNGESMNRVMPNHSLIAIKKYDSVSDLVDGDIVAFDDADKMCVKQFYKDYKSKIYSFMSNSTDNTYKPINYRWEDAKNIRIIGKIVTYVINI